MQHVSSRRGAGGGRLAAGVVICLLALAHSSWAAVAAREVFTVADVAVDVTAENAAVARETALAEGEQAAFRRLLERLTLRSDHSRLPAVGRGQVAAHVQDLSVAEEKTSAVRYLAKLTFRFKAEAVRRFLSDQGLPFAETPSKPVLVLPVYQAAGAVLLWDDPNPWREAWRKAPIPDGLVPWLLPVGDLPDVAAVGAEQAVAGDEQRLAAVAHRYRTTDTVVASAALGFDPQKGAQVLRVAVARYGASPSRGQTEIEYAANSNESADAFLTRGAAEVARLIEDNWKRENLVQLGREAVAAVSVPITGLGDWLEVRNRLAGVAIVRRADTVLLSRTEVRINLLYIGEPDQLVLALQQADLQLQREGNLWVLSLAGPEEKF